MIFRVLVSKFGLIIYLYQDQAFVLGLSLAKLGQSLF